jgi:methylenetetrahydrofolate reductase (NADPH)
MPGVAALVQAACDESEPANRLPKFSFEYFPPRQPSMVEKLYSNVYRMCRQGPMFIDLTWGAGGSTSALTLGMCTNFKKHFGVEVNMHLTCTNITAESVRQALVDAKDAGITSIVALRGDPPLGQKKWESTEGGFECALDLVKYIRGEHGDYFSIAVSGYPEGHPNAIRLVEDETKLSETERGRLIRDRKGQLMVCYDEDYVKEIAYLKAKVDAGAEVVITQLFFDPAVFLTFVDTCREAGITVPILPGIMILGTFAGFERMTDLCKTRVPDAMVAKLAEAKVSDAAFAAFGVEYITQLCKTVWASNKVPSLHFYCLNQPASVFQILSNLGVSINHLDSDGEKTELARIDDIIKTLAPTPAPKAAPPREEIATTEESAQKKTKTA